MLLARSLEMRRRTPSRSTARYLEVSFLLATLVSTDTSKTGPAQVEHATRSTTADPPLAWIHSLAANVRSTSMVSPPVQPGYVLRGDHLSIRHHHILSVRGVCSFSPWVEKVPGTICACPTSPCIERLLGTNLQPRRTRTVLVSHESTPRRNIRRCNVDNVYFLIIGAALAAAVRS